MCKKLFEKIKLKRERKKIYGNVLEVKHKYKKQGLYYDKVEKTKEYKACVEEVDKLANDEALKILNGKMQKGYCHIFWGCKKQILNDKYNIDWRSPAEMNLGCKFD